MTCIHAIDERFQYPKDQSWGFMTRFYPLLITCMYNAGHSLAFRTECYYMPKEGELVINGMGAPACWGD